MSVFVRLIAAALLALATLQTLRAAPLAPPSAVHYAIDVTLDPSSNRLTGTTAITWHRRDRAIGELRFQLFLNAWRNARSTWMRHHGAAAPDPWSTRWGGIDLARITLETAGGSIDLTPAARFIAPDDGNGDDRTVVEAPLPGAIGAADAVVIRLEWTASLPSYVGDTGARGGHVFLARWAPQLCDVEAAGWRCPQAHPSGLTPAEPADYEVRISAPDGWVVGATGRLAARTTADHRVIHSFSQRAVRAFAWTASPDFVDVTVHVPTDAPVDVRLLVLPEHRSQIPRFVDAVEESLVQYRAFAPYPYDHLTVVDAAWHTHPGGAGYPGLVTVGGRWLSSNAASEAESDLARGVAQQWWGNLVAIDPSRDGITARAIADYVHTRVVAALFNRHRGIVVYAFRQQRFFGGFIPWTFPSVRLDAVTDGLGLESYRAFQTAGDPAAMPPPGDREAAAIRARAALAFATLERYTGWPAIQRGLAAVAERFAFQNVSRDQVFQTLSTTAGQDLSWFFHQTFDGSAVFDYAVADLTSEEQRPGACGAPPCFRTVVVLRRLGEAEFTGTAELPRGAFQSGRALTLLVRFADGSQVTDRWDGRARWRAFEYESRSAAVSAAIDPERVLLLDVHTANNSRSRSPASSSVATTWAARWMIWLQQVLLTYASLV